MTKTERDALMRQAIARGWCAPENSHKTMDPDLVEAIAREIEVLPASDAEPVAWRPRWDPPSGHFQVGLPSQQSIDYYTANAGGIEYAYAAPPALPDEMDMALATKHHDEHYAQGWNDCRAAMLGTKPPEARCKICNDTGWNHGAQPGPYYGYKTEPCKCGAKAR